MFAVMHYVLTFLCCRHISTIMMTLTMLLLFFFVQSDGRTSDLPLRILILKSMWMWMAAWLPALDMNYYDDYRFSGIRLGVL